MRALLDVNVLIALLDGSHIHHRLATDWLERPITLNEGTNTLVGTDPKVIVKEARRVLAGKGKAGQRPDLWDGQTAVRIVAQLETLLNGNTLI